VTTLRTINCAEASDRAAFFVLGALDTREALEVREHLETCSRAHEEFAEIGGVVPHLAELPDEVEPGSELRVRLLAAVEADVRARRREGDAAERLVASFGARPRTVEADEDEPRAVAVGPGLPAPREEVVATDGPAERETAVDRSPTRSALESGAETAAVIDITKPAEIPAASAPLAAAAPAQPAPVVAEPQPEAFPVVSPVERRAPIEAARVERRRRPSMGWLVAAAAVLAVVGLGAWSILLQGQVAEQRDHLAAIQAALVARNQPNAIVAVLAGTDAAPAASGTAVMPPGRPGYLVLLGLQPAPAGKTYQAWFLSGKESRSAGLLKVGADGMAILSGLDPQQPIDAMAVTLEQDGGVERSSQEPLVYGKVRR
jgi:anti-sigma-K factor RskA/putative zinc finger protein